MSDPIKITDRDVLLVVDVQNDFCPGGNLAVPHGDEVVPVINLLAYGEQVLWPDHCVQATPGAAFRQELDIPHAELVLRKGYHRAIDSYSAFYENDKKTRTGLAGYLRERGLTRVFVAGLAFDFCVRFSCEDARREGFETIVVADACRGIDLAGSMDKTRRALAELGIGKARSDDLS